MREFGITLILVGMGIFLLIAPIALIMWAYPQYKVWSSGVAIEQLENRGKQKLAQAEQERQILIAQAKAEKESAQLRADAIAIVGKAAKEYPEYRNQEFIGAFAEAMNNGAIDKIIYVPTEANIPVLEAGKR